MVQSSTTKGTNIVMKNVSASWTTNVIVNTLHNISIQVKPGKLYAVVGSVGAGKVYIYISIYIYIYVYIYISIL